MVEGRYPDLQIMGYLGELSENPSARRIAGDYGRQIIHRFGRQAILWCVVLAFSPVLFLFTGCGPRIAADTIAVVGERQLTAEELRTFVLNLLPGLYTTKQGQAAREDYLQSLIDQHILLLEADESDLDKDPQVVEKLQNLKENYLADLFRQREILPQVQVSEEEIRRLFTEQGLARERFLTAILVRTEAEARQLLARLESGAAFGELARDYSLDPRSAQRGGELGFVNRVTAGRLGIPGSLFDTLPARTVSPPLPRGQTYHLIRFLDERTVDLETQQATIKAQLMRERQQELEDRKVELLAYDRGLAMDARGLAVLAAQVQSLSGRGLQLDPAARQTPLFTYKRGAITVGTYLEALYARRIKNTQALLDSSFVSAIVRWFILPDRLFMEAAEEEGLVQESEFLRWEKRTKEELLLKTLQQRQVSEQVSLDEEEVRRYVQENPDNFLTPKEICFDELVVPNEEKASRIKAEIPPTADLIEVARRYKLPVRPRRPDGLVCMTIQTKTLYPHLWEALDTAPIGALGGPVPTHEGYALFRVVRRQDPQPEPYEQARKRARSALQQRAEQVRFNAWMAQLREKYQDRIAIYPDRLEQALPEAMLASVTRPPGEQN